MPERSERTAALPGTNALGEALGAVVRLGILLLRCGTTDFRVTERMQALAPRLGIERLEAQVTLDGIVATAACGGHVCTLISQNTLIGVNAYRLSALEAVPRAVVPETTPAAVHAMLDRIEKSPPLHPAATVALAVGLACGAFCLLNGGRAPDFLLVTLSGGLGQALRSRLLRQRLNQFVTTLLCAVAAATLYCFVAQCASRFGHVTFNHAAGFISSVLFLIPGFPLITSLLDLIRFRFVSGLTRMAYSTMLLLSGAVGICVVASVAGLTTAPPPAAPGMPVVATLLLRTVASFFGGWGFAVLYNSTQRAALTVGLLSLLGNSLRLSLHDFGMALVPATFLGALLVGLLATPVSARVQKPRLALKVPGIIVMVPGTLAYHTIILFNQGEILAALRDGVLATFIVGAMAMGLVAARLISDRQWAFE